MKFKNSIQKEYLIATLKTIPMVQVIEQEDGSFLLVRDPLIAHLQLEESHVTLTCKGPRKTAAEILAHLTIWILACGLVFGICFAILKMMKLLGVLAIIPAIVLFFILAIRYFFVKPQEQTFLNELKSYLKS